MTKISDILQFMNQIAPICMKESWDKVGLNCGHLDHLVTKILVALDPFDSACQEAAEFGADLLITHHPLLWDSEMITDNTEQGKRTLFLIEHGIAHINAHTNLDCAPGGVNDILAKKLGLENIQVINPIGQHVTGQPYGLLRSGTIAVQPLEKFLKTVKNSLGCPCLRYVSGGSFVNRVAVGGGSCGSELMQAVQAGCDTFVTADIKYNQFWDAEALGLNLIDAGHFYTENPVCYGLARQLREFFPDLIVKVSEKHKDCMKFF